MQFVDLKRQYDEYKMEIMAEIQNVLDSTAFINGPAVQELEAQLAEHTGVRHAIGCSSGTDALTLGMMALDVQPGDEIILPDFTFIATAETVALLGAVPVFADIRPDTCNVDPESIRAAITEKTVGIIPVSLYGQVADMDEINAIATEHGLWVMEDGAQSYGATYKGKRSGGLSQIGTTSFFPAKPLGAYGDAGAVFTNDDELAARLRMILNHGQRKRYDHAVIGLNARLDTLQAAVLKVKLRHFDDEVLRRQQVADWYTAAFAGVREIVTPTILDHNTSVWAQYTIRVPHRPAVQAALKEKGIPTAVHYPIPLHKQDAFAEHAQHDIEVPHTEKASNEVMSLPMHPFMTREDVTTVAEAVKDSVLEPVNG
jgi:UDP-2-acetamido-2-deoxy-ribo-hexuluronate aminotransferase